MRLVRAIIAAVSIIAGPALANLGQTFLPALTHYESHLLVR